MLEPGYGDHRLTTPGTSVTAALPADINIGMWYPLPQKTGCFNSKGLSGNRFEDLSMYTGNKVAESLCVFSPLINKSKIRR